MISSSRNHVQLAIVTAESESAHMNEQSFISNSVGKASNENGAAVLALGTLARCIVRFPEGQAQAKGQATRSKDGMGRRRRAWLTSNHSEDGQWNP